MDILSQFLYRIRCFYVGFLYGIYNVRKRFKSSFIIFNKKIFCKTWPKFYGKVFKAQFPFANAFLFYKKYSFSNILMSFLQRSNKKPMGKAQPYCGFLYTRLWYHGLRWPCIVWKKLLNQTYQIVWNNHDLTLGPFWVAQ